MKMFIGLLTIAMSFSSLASSGESKTFTYDGTQSSIQLVLNGEKTHTEYRTETVQSVCYRQEVVGYRTICTGGYGGPGPGPRPGPRPVPGRVCTQQPIWRTISYPCLQTVRTAYEVKDYDVSAQVLLDVAAVESSLKPNEKFTITLHGDDLTVTAQGSKNFFLVLKKKDQQPYMNGSVKFIDALYAVELVEAAPVLNALSMTNISIKDSLLSVKLGKVTVTENLGFSLEIAKKRTLGSDTTIFDRELAAGEFDIVSAATGSILTVDTDKLNTELSGGKFSLTAKAFFKVNGTVMNKSQFGDSLEVSRTLIYTNR